MKNLFLLLVLVGIHSQLAAQASMDRDKPEVAIQFYQKIPMRDGISLAANVFRPAEQTAPLPVILIITPYIMDENHDRGMFFARNGYVFVTVDCRGRGSSEGNFVPFANDGEDGHDVVSWIGQQPWCNGQVGMLGGSYRGMNQWLTLKEFPAALKTIIPIASVGPGLDFPKYNNIFYPYMLRWLMFTDGRALNEKLFGADFWEVKKKELYENHIPFMKYDSLVGFPHAVFQNWLSHPAHDEFWQGILLDKEDYAKIDIPILTITGHFDGDQIGAMHYYQQHMIHGNSAVKQKHYFISGPWSHGGTRRPAAALFGLEFGENAVLDMNQLYLDWFDWTLKKQEKPALLKDRVMYYVMGDNQWKYAPEMETLSNELMPLFLSSVKSDAKDVFHSGDLLNEPQKSDTAPDVIRYDPLSNAATRHVHYDQVYSNTFFVDQAYISQENLLFYHSAPLSEALEVTGKISFEAYLSINVPDVDFEVRMDEITPKGESIYLQSDILRARYRLGLEKEVPVPAGKVLRYTFSGRDFFSRKLQKGSRIRLTFGPLDSIGRQKNYLSGKDVAQETAADAQVAEIKLYHNKKYPSAIYIPITSK